ncbi:MAG TPA: DUF58 domain-containing protein [Vicinamibacterales bacterium]|nr:DUF58 domain-containing protein [Vicinamibacterales bacterium]
MSSALDPAVVAAVGDLELAARLIVEGLRAGEHRSPFHGFSHEFSQYRAYRPGDDLKYLDWKMLGRTDRLYTRQFRETTNMSVTLVIDASASMGFPVTGVSKLRYAAVVASAIAYLVVTAGDAVGLLSSGGAGLAYLPARGGRLHLGALLQRLSHLEAAGRWEPPKVIGLAAERLRRRGLVLVLSDFYDDEDATFVALKRAAAVGHEVVILHVVSREERDLPYDGAVAFDDLETGERRLVDAATVRDDYRARMAAFCDGWRDRARRAGLDYVPLGTDVPPARALRHYLLRRQGAVPA